MGARKLIKQCLTTDPKERITIEELITDRWLTRSHFGPIRNLLPTFSKYEFDEDVVGHMAQFFNVSRRDVKLKLSEWNYDRFLAIYQVIEYFLGSNRLPQIRQLMLSCLLVVNDRFRLENVCCHIS